jgi:hypothetical protein
MSLSASEARAQIGDIESHYLSGAGDLSAAEAQIAAEVPTQR